MSTNLDKIIYPFPHGDAHLGILRADPSGYRPGEQGHQHRPPVAADFRYAAGHRIHQDECGDKEVAHDGGRGAVFPGDH